MKRPVHQDPNNPVCEGSGIEPILDLGIFTTEPTVTICPGCGHRFSETRDGRIRKHRRLPDPATFT